MAAVLSVPQRLLVLAALSGGVAFAGLLAYGKPGLGIGQCLFVPVILAAAATSPAAGVLAGMAALFLYELALNERTGLAWDDFTTLAALTRLGSYAAAGAVTGFLALRGRRMLAQALHVLDELVAIAHTSIAAQEAGPQREDRPA